MQTSNSNQHIALSYLFSASVLNELLRFNYSERLVQIFNDFNILDKINSNVTVKDFFEDAYKELLKHYRNEYVFKNAIAEKILIGRHSVKSSSLFTEFRVHTSKADVVIFNGTSHVYEIKTDLDKLDRLQSQIDNYKQVFEYVNVVSVASKVEAVMDLVDDSVGILVLTDRYTLKTVRKARSQLENLRHDALFDTLRKDEYIKIISKLHSDVPELPNTKVYAACKKIFRQLPIEQVHRQMVNVLKERTNREFLDAFIKKIPSSLKIAILESNLSEKEQSDFLALLNQKVVNILNQRGRDVSSVCQG